MCKGLVIIYRGGGGLVQIGGGSPLFIHGLKGGGEHRKIFKCIASC